MTTGTNFRTGTRNSPNPYIASLGSLRQENPERFLSPSDPSRFLQIARQAANEDSYRQQYIAQQNQQAAYNRQRNANIESSQREEAFRQNDFNRRMQEKEWDARQAGRKISITNTVDNSAQINFARQKQLAQMQNQMDLVRADRDRYNQQILEQQRRDNERRLEEQRQVNDRTMQAAQLAAQQRLAQTQQDTALLGGFSGESTWRWF